MFLLVFPGSPPTYCGLLYARSKQKKTPSGGLDILLTSSPTLCLWLPGCQLRQRGSQGIRETASAKNTAFSEDLVVRESG